MIVNIIKENRLFFSEKRNFRKIIEKMFFWEIIFQNQEIFENKWSLKWKYKFEGLKVSYFV